MIRQTVGPFRSATDIKTAQKMFGSRNQFDKLPIRMALSERRPGSSLIQTGTLPMPPVPGALNQPEPSHLPDVAFSGPSVILKPPSQTLAKPMTASQSGQESSAVSSIPLPGQGPDTMKAHEVVNQASVIVHSRFMEVPPYRGLLESRSLHSLSSYRLSESVPFPDQILGPSTVEMSDQRASSFSDGPYIRLDSSDVLFQI